MIEKTTVLVFHANLCVNLCMSEIENRHSTFPMYAHVKKRFYLEHLRAALWSLQTLSNANTAEKWSVKVHRTLPLCFSPPSHYLICYCGHAINFLSVAVLFNSVQPACYVASIKALQYEHIDSGVNDSEYRLETRYSVFARHSLWIKDDSWAVLI